MRVACFSSKSYDRQYLGNASQIAGHDWQFLEPRLDATTAPLAAGFDAVCAFVNDKLDAPCVEALAKTSVRFIVLRCSGFNQIDLVAAKKFNLRVARVPKYSPYAVAEHTIGLILTLNRKIHKAYNRVRDNNFSLEGLLGFDLHGRTAGVIGTGAIGSTIVKILHGFGCQVLMYDLFPNEQCRLYGTYVSLPELLTQSDIVTLHCPLTPDSFHLINSQTLPLLKPGSMLVNTSRGALIDTRAAIESLKQRHLGGLALDVYEEESELFFRDLSEQVIDDDVFSRLLTFPNVLVTAHQAFFTREALTEIAKVTMDNLRQFASGGKVDNEVIGGGS